jgi:hypothetical protein
VNVLFYAQHARNQEKISPQVGKMHLMTSGKPSLIICLAPELNIVFVAGYMHSFSASM